MGLFGKKNKYVDLSKRLERHEERINNIKENMVETKPEQKPEEQSSGGGFFSFFGGSGTASSVTPEEDPEEKRKKMAQRIMYLTQKLEDQEKEIFQLKQRMDVIERKQKAGY